MIWLDWTFNAALGNELTFDHWLVVEAELVPIDRLCLSRPFVWEVRLEADLGFEVRLMAALGDRLALAAPFGFPIELAGAITNPVNLAAELKCC